MHFFLSNVKELKLTLKVHEAYKLVTVNFQSLKTGQSQLQIEHPQLISADGKHKSVEAVEATIKAFPQANLMQAFKKLEVKNIFATKNKKKKVVKFTVQGNDRDTK